MSEGVREKIEQKVEQAVLRLLSYYAVFGLAATEAEVNSYIGIRVGHLAVRDALRELTEVGKLSRATDGSYRLAGHTHHSRETMLRRQEVLVAKARRWARLFGLLPFIKSVVVVNSAALGNVTAESDVDLLIVTKPNRIYIAKGILMYGLKFLRQLETEENKAGRFSLGMFVTTAGVNWQRDIMAVNDPHLAYWLMLARPVYGASVWQNLLKTSPYLQEAFPNYVWPKAPRRIYSGGLTWLDQLDSKGYRKHLKHTAGQPKMHTKEAFVRVRPDILNLHALDQSGKIARKYQRILESIKVSVSKD